MPYELNGTYYSVDEVAKACGVNYSILCRRIKNLKMNPLRVGQGMLLTSEQRHDLVRLCTEIVLTEQKSVSIAEAALRWGLSLAKAKKLISLGVPTVSFHGRTCRLSEEVVEAVTNHPELENRKPNLEFIAAMF